MDSVKVSVVIPTYKRATRLTEAIDSALNQSYKNIEIIVVDDNDPNTEFRKKTEELMLKYQNNEKVRYIKHDKNKNGAAARNTGIRNARGEYIALLDDDDQYFPQKVEKQVDFLNHNVQYAAVYCGRIQNGKTIHGELQGDLSEHILLGTFTPTTPALMFRKEALIAIDGFNEEFRRHQDYELLLRFFRKYKIGAIREPLVEIGINEGENALHGKALENTKKQYLALFSDDINRIDSVQPGFRRKVYLDTYRYILFDDLSQMDFLNAFKYYIKGCQLAFMGFNKKLLSYACIYIKLQIRRKRRKTIK